MGLSLDEIKANYQNYPDYKIVDIAQYKAGSLKEGVIEILKDEILTRNLDNSLIAAIDMQMQPLDEEVLVNIVLKIKQLACPQCSDVTHELEAAQLVAIYGVGIESVELGRVFIACPTCIEAEKKKVLRQNLLLGWWSPWGFIQTPKVIFKSYFKKKKGRRNQCLVVNQFCSRASWCSANND